MYGGSYRTLGTSLVSSGPFLGIAGTTTNPFSVLASCSSKSDEELCVAEGNTCMYVVDGYYVCVGICVAIGIVWYAIFFRRIQRIQKIERREWHVTRVAK